MALRLVAPARILLLATLVVALAACGLLPELEPVPSGPLVTIETRGGECPAGACGETVVIERDGRVHVTVPQAMNLGRLPDGQRIALDQAVRAADFDALRRRPFTGECPVNFDGQESIFTFATTDGPVRLASCEVEIDPLDPLFAAVEAALAAIRR